MTQRKKSDKDKSGERVSHIVLMCTHDFDLHDTLTHHLISFQNCAMEIQKRVVIYVSGFKFKCSPTIMRIPGQLLQTINGFKCHNHFSKSSRSFVQILKQILEFHQACQWQKYQLHNFVEFQ